MKKIEILTRKQCPTCKGKGSYVFTGSHDRESTVTCNCADWSNPAKAGFVLTWITIEVPE
jgi:hypothetical protein